MWKGKVSSCKGFYWDDWGNLNMECLLDNIEVKFFDCVYGFVGECLCLC